MNTYGTPAAKLREFAAAIRRGAKLGYQCFGGYTDGAGTCAIGAACVGMGITSFDGFMPDILGIPISMHDEIVSLNDSDRMTREEIADMLDAEADKIDGGQSASEWARKMVERVTAANPEIVGAE